MSIIPEFILFYSATDEDGSDYVDAVSFSDALAVVDFLCSSSVKVLYISRLEDTIYA